MSISTAFSAFFAILFNKSQSKLWQKAQTGELIGRDKHQIALEEATTKGNDQGRLDAKKDFEGQVKKFEADIAELKKSLKNANADQSDAIYTLVLMQREGRLVDFLQEDMSPFSDDQIGAAARQVHTGCRKVLKDYFNVKPVLNQVEGDSVDVPEGFNPSEYELTGNVSGSAPYKGELRHKGWKVSQLNLPQRQQTTGLEVICPAEVEV